MPPLVGIELTELPKSRWAKAHPAHPLADHWHTTYSWNINWQKCVGMGFNGLIFKKINENWNIKTKKKSWEPFRRCLLNSTANPAQFGWKLAELAVKPVKGFICKPQELGMPKVSLKTPDPGAPPPLIFTFENPTTAKIQDSFEFIKYLGYTYFDSYMFCFLAYQQDTKCYQELLRT